MQQMNNFLSQFLMDFSAISSGSSCIFFLHSPPLSMLWFKLLCFAFPGFLAATLLAYLHASCGSKVTITQYSISITSSAFTDAHCSRYDILLMQTEVKGSVAILVCLFPFQAMFSWDEYYKG